MDEEIKNKIENNIRNKRYYKKIRAMIVYGSWVRGDFDENSDIDILVITEGQYSIDENKIHEIVSECIQGRPIDISVYDAAKFETLLTSGSLFLHHVKDEGEIIFDRSGKGKNYLFGKLNEFKGISEDMLLYKRMYSKAVISLENNGVNYYDINILSLVARNTLILACYHQKQPKYGKWDAFHLCKDYFDTEIQLSEKCYKELLEYRNYFNRNLDKHELPNQNRCREYENQVGMLIDWGIKLTGVNNTVDRLFYLFNDRVGRNFYTSYEVFTDFDRDIFMFTNLYLQKEYKDKIDSIRDPFLELLRERYPNDEYVKCVCAVVGEFNNIKKESSNYSIDTPDIYSEVNIKNSYAFKDEIVKILHIKEGSLLDKAIVKIMNKLGVKEKKDILQLLEQLRRYINEL